MAVRKRLLSPSCIDASPVFVWYMRSPGSRRCVVSESFAFPGHMTDISLAQKPTLLTF